MRDCRPWQAWPRSLASLRERAAPVRGGALLLVDTAPIICQLEAHTALAARLAPLFQRHAAGGIVLAISAHVLVIRGRDFADVSGVQVLGRGFAALWVPGVSGSVRLTTKPG